MEDDHLSNQLQQSSEDNKLRVDTELDTSSPSIRVTSTAPDSPFTVYSTDRETVFHPGNTTMAETHLLRSTGLHSQSFTEEHWTSEITSFVATAPPKFIQVIKAYRVLSTDTPTLVVEVASDPPAIFEWFCNDKPVLQDRHQFHARHGLNITTLTIDHPEQGVYKCTARNPAGLSTSYGYISVNFEPGYSKHTENDQNIVEDEGGYTVIYNQAPRFINQVPNLTVQPGSEAVIDVEVDANPAVRFSWFVNGREFRESSDNVVMYYPKENQCIARFAIPVSGEYKVIASNVHGSAMSSGYVEIHRFIPSRQMRPPVAPGEHISRNMMSVSHHLGSNGQDGHEMLTTHQMVNVYEVNYSQRSSSVPRGVRHLERHIEIPQSPESRELEHHRAERHSLRASSEHDRSTLHVMSPLQKTKSEGVRYLPHPPRFITQLPSEINVKPNEKLVLSVDVSAIPTADFKWNVNGFEVKPSKNITLLNEQNRSTLVIHPPVKQGKYNVTATNDAGMDALLTKVTHIITDIVEEIHSDIRIDTRGISNPPDIVESAITVTSIHESEWDLAEDDESSTSFETVMVKDEKKKSSGYFLPPEAKQNLNRKQQISHSNKEQTVVQSSFIKNTMITKNAEEIPHKPTILEKPAQKIHVNRGETLVLESRVDSVPASRFRWYVNNFEVKNSQFIIVDESKDNLSRVTFLKPVPGQYKVVATNFMGSVSTVTRVTSEVIKEEYDERITVTTTVKPADMYKLIKKQPIRENKDLPKSPSITEKLPLTLRIGQNQPLVLKVSADAIPEANFMWLINNFELKPNANVSINKPGLNQSEICLRKTLPGKYSVFARNTLGQDFCSCKVIVEYDESIKEDQQEAPALLKKLPKETLHTSGMETPLSITVLGLAPFIFRWFINETEVEKDEFQTIVDRNKSILVLKRALKEGTIIAAEAKNKYGVTRSQTIIKNAENQAEATEESQVSSKVFLSKKSPVFVKCLEDIVLNVGDTLLCGVGIDKNCDPCEFEWSINSEQIIDTESRITIDSTTHESIVCINEISMLATGHLTVVAKNNYGSSVSSALLSVTQRRDEPFEMVPPNLPEESAPKIVEPLHSVSFIDGQPMVLRCRIVANPSAVIVWSKDDINVDEWVINKDVTTQILPEGVCELLIPECYPEDSGLYKCAATNPHGTAETAAYINVEGLSYYKDTEEASASESCSVGLDDLEMDRTKIIFPPKFIENLTPETDAITELGYIRLVCKVKSETPLDVTWWMNNTEVHQNEKYDIYQFSDGTQILTIHGATNNDNGVYTCKAESGYGLSTSSCEVDVPEKQQYDELIKENITMCTRTIQGDSDWTSISIIEPKLDATVLIEPNKEDVSGTTEIKKHEEEFKLLVKVADSVASTLVANVFINAVKEAVKKIVEESEEESETVVDMECPPRFDTSIEEYVATQNDSIKISTTVSGYPTPFIEWYFRENKIIVTEKISMSYENGFAALNFKEIQPHQEGTYYCHATNIHGTTVLSCKLRVVSEKKGDNIRFSLAKYDKHDAQQEVVTNVFVHSKENYMEQIINIASSNKDIQKANFMALSQPVRNLEIINGREEKKNVRDIHADKEVLNMEESNEDNAIVSFPTQEGQIIPLLKIEEEEEKLNSKRMTAGKFEESLTENIISQTQNIVLTPLPFGQDPSSTQLITTSSTVILDKEEDSGRRSVTMPYEEKVKVIEDRLKTASSLDISPQEAVNMIMNTVIALKEQHITDETTNVDIRNPPAKFDHVVTVVEPEVVQFCLHLSASTTPSFKFIDLETILQKPSTSSDTNTLLASTKKRSANAEYRIVVLEGVSKSFQNAITWSLKKVQKLTSETPENAAYANIEVIKPSETNEKVMKIVDTEKMIPDLLQVAATASKLKLENVTISLVRHGDTAHQQLIIEYEGAVEEEETNLNVSHLIYHRLDEESKEQVWSRRSRYSDRDVGNIVAVFVEVDACCPDQSVEIVASVNTPTEAKAANDDESSPELLDASESVTESSSAIGIQAPKFFRKLIDNQALVGNSVQFKCIVSGTPTPDVVWSVDGDIIEPNQEYDLVYEDGVCILRIHETLPEDEGEYCCEAINSAGKAITKCFLKVIKKEPRTPRHFIEHAPSLTELIDEEEQHSFDSFEWEERKANALFGAEESLDSLFESPNRLVISNSDFDVSKAINYNEDMEETNAFHKYFETAETVVNVTELEQFTSVHGLFHACIPTNFPVNVLSTSITDIFFSNPKLSNEKVLFNAHPKMYVHTVISASISDPRNNIINNNDLWKEIFNDPFSKELEDHSFEHIENNFYEPRTPLLPQKLFYRGQEIGISVTEVKKEQAQVNEKGEVEIAMKTCLETSLEFHAPVNAFSVPKKNVILKESKEIDETKTLLVPITSSDKCFIESFNIDQSDELSISNQLNSISLPERPVIHQNLEFIDKVKEIERIARQVDQELCHLSGNTSGNELSGDAQEIEKAIFKISDQLVLQNPVSEAQAEASEELLRTTLADMILNPTRTAEEEIELMKRPIRLLRRKLSDIENSLLEDVEVTNITETAQGTSIRTTSSDTPATIMTPPLKKRVPSAEYLRMTPLTSTIKDQLTCLEEMINEHLNSESPSVSEDITSGSKVQRVRSAKKRELHDLFVQINNEINTIKSFCKSKLSKKGSDAVMNVLHKVRTHVTSIVNVMSLTKKKRAKVATKDKANTEIRYHFKCPEAREKVEGIMVFKRSSMESSLANQSSTALSTSDDTWRYSTELKTSSSDKRLSNISLQPVTEKIGVEMEPNAIAEQIPFPPPRKRRTMSSEPAVCEPPVPPPRRMKLESHEKEVISDCSKDVETMELLEFISEEPFSPPTKPKRSFTGDSLEALLQFSNELAKTEQEMTQYEMEISLLNELKKISVSKSKCKQENYDLNIVSDTSTQREKEKIGKEICHEVMEDNFIAFETKNDVIEVHYEGTYATIAFCKETALKVELEIPLCTLTTILFHIPVDDGSSVQMVCEESDYATDTDTSCLLKGTVQFFNRYSPLDPNRRSSTSINLAQRHSKIFQDYLKEEVGENTEDIVVNIELKSVNSEGDIGSLGPLNLCGMVIYDSHRDKKLEKTEEQTSQKNVYLSTIMERSSDMTSVHTDSSDTKIKYTSDETIHMVMEENLLSQMESSVKTDDDVDRRINSRNTIRETDILSDESAIIEIEQSVTDYVEETFSYTRLSARRKLLAIISYEIRQAASATVYSDNTFDVIIEQEPEILGVNIKVIEDQVDFTSLTILSDYDCDYFDMLEPQRVFDDYTENSSLEDVEGEIKTGISVSIIARSLHDGIYASLEEIPWGEVQMTVNEVDNMGRSIEDESKLNSVQFSVTVSESNADEKKSLRSQTSFNQSQNSISEIENTISTGSINIPSYVIKIGSTATITCELNNYLPPKSHIEWYKGKYHLERKAGKLDRISHDLLEVLIINNVQMTDNDLYSLKVNDDIFPVAYLIVEGQSSEEINAVIVTPPQTQFVMEGQPTVLMVQAKNTIQPVYWLKDRNPLQENNRLHFEITEGGWNKVILLETHLSDQGTYYAVLGEQSIAITLVVEERIDEKEVTVIASGTESEDEDVQEYLVPPGSTATIACELEASDHIRTLAWLKDGRMIVFDNSMKLEHVINGLKHYLVIHDTSSSDSGLYSVSISNTEFRVAHLSVNDLATSIQGLKRKIISNNSLH